MALVAALVIFDILRRSRDVILTIMAHARRSCQRPFIGPHLERNRAIYFLEQLCRPTRQGGQRGIISGRHTDDARKHRIRVTQGSRVRIRRRKFQGRPFPRSFAREAFLGCIWGICDNKGTFPRQESCERELLHTFRKGLRRAREIFRSTINWPGKLLK